MNTIYKSYKFKLSPNAEQIILLDKHFGCNRFVYNHFLNQRKEQYQATKKSDNYYVQAASLTQLKKVDDTSWLKEVNSQSLQFALRCLDSAYVNFFSGKSKFPKFKSKRDNNTFTIPQFAEIINNEIRKRNIIQFEFFFELGSVEVEKLLEEDEEVVVDAARRELNALLPVICNLGSGLI